jgi:DNA-binding MarR family transcriptional regulator
MIIGTVHDCANRRKSALGHGHILSRVEGDIIRSLNERRSRNDQERLNMNTDLELTNTDLRFWYLIHRTRDWLRVCEDRIFSKYGLTTEQYAVLATMKYLGNPTRPTDIARWLERSTNSISIIVERMVRAGLVKRIRDSNDRRVVRLTITGKGEDALKPAILVGSEFLQQVLSPLSREDRHALVTSLETVKYEAYKYANPAEAAQEITGSQTRRQADLAKRLTQFISSSTPEA